MTQKSAPTNPSVVITGASTGIGKACALHLAQQGWRVFAGVRKPADAGSLQQANPAIEPVFVDVQKPDTISAAAGQVAQAVGPGGLDGLVNNAGIAIGGPLEFLPLAEFKKQLDVNVTGQIAVTQAFLPLLRAKPGRIVNMSSISGRVATPFVGPYSASKFALEAVTDTLRGELHPWGIHVVSVQPGAIATPIWKKAQTYADYLNKTLPEECFRLYRTAFDDMAVSVQQAGERGVPPEKVAQTVARALTAKRPKTRYIVGADAKIAAVLKKLLPDRWLDALLRQSRHLP
ncbi:MAG: SDR family oxidoreductase [Chloroflexi bacterium]|nr:MAG: SDR family oxidoreductase [Chloroflexota bacterium]